ncbi:hypothetical protein [Phycicoccus sp. 3266]|uniref:hypothetical protein n=1 Tax=Phycicoccus sp. 3266 TaxID=2817751 RepID=UPI0028577F32|nr:hypothetical protein [Phycicoccus sp. 3266]MDR6862163.1 hypothetical protein [Phycicoccus sp. 3266]
MTGSVESSSHARGLGVFPPEWGTPPGTTFSEERALWVAMNITRRGATSQRALRRVEEMRMRDLRQNILELARKRSL